MEKNQNNLDNLSELDKFLSGLTHSTKIFLISQEERLLNDPLIKQKFTQGAIVNTLSQYLDEMNLNDGFAYLSSTRYDDSDSDSDSDLPTRPFLSRFS